MRHDGWLYLSTGPRRTLKNMAPAGLSGRLSEAVRPKAPRPAAVPSY